MVARWLILLCLTGASQISTMAQLAAEGQSTHWNHDRGYAPFAHATPDGVVISDSTTVPISDSYRLTRPAASFSLRFNAANANNHPAKSYKYFDSDGNRKGVKNPAWGFYIKGIGEDSLVFKIRTVEMHDALSSETAVSISARPIDSESKDITIKEGIDHYCGNNNWELSMKDGMATLSGGNRCMQQLLTLPTGLREASEFGFISCPGAAISVTDITFTDRTPAIDFTQWSNPDHLRNYISASKDPLEGYWTLFDRTLEESLLLLGGDYQLAMVKDGNEYALIYLGGARINSGLWQPGMVKARLRPSVFPGIFDVEWTDAEGMAIFNAVKGQIGDGDMLTIQFPYHSSTLRLRKMPAVVQSR